MKEFLKRGSALLLCTALLAGCSGSPADSSQSQSSDKSSESSDPSAVTGSLVENLIEVSQDDQKAQEAWQKIFQYTADHYKGTFESGGEGEIYEYQTGDQEGFVTAHMLYETGRESLVSTQGNTILAADVLDLDNSNDAFMSGSGVLSRIDKDSKSAVVKLTDTHDNNLVGNVVSVLSENYSPETFAAENLMDSSINAGFARTVDPVHNSSLYSYDLEKTLNGYVLNLKVKDVDSFHEQARTGTVLFRNLDEKMVIGLDEVTDETFVFRFTKDGVLKEIGNNIFHAIYDDGNKTYVNVRTVTEVEDLDDPADFNRVIGDFMEQIESGALSEGSDFHLTDWQ